MTPHPTAARLDLDALARDLLRSGGCRCAPEARALAREAHVGNTPCGTKADFYVGRGPTAEWVGSIAWDGYPEAPGVGGSLAGVAVLGATTEQEFRTALTRFLAQRTDVILPRQG